jgi:predicted RNA-binding Zn-ribbon protein involved in translation (DUF1610 family)
MAATSLRGNNGSRVRTEDRGLNRACAVSETGAVFGSPVSDAHLIKFQCPQCGHELEQSIQSLKQSARMCCRGCGVGINIDTNRLANAAEEMRRALEKVPPEITIKFFR